MALSLRKARGVWALVGPPIDEIAHRAIQTCPRIQVGTQIPYHMTVVSKDELQGLSSSHLEQESTELDTRHVFDAGVGGGQNGVFFVVVIWAAGQQLRKRLGLAPKHFHITLTSCDNHDVDKSIRSLLPNQPTPSSPEFLDHLSFTSFVFSHYHDASQSAIKLIVASPESQKGFLRLADASLASAHFKTAMLAYAQAHDTADEDKLKKYCLKKMVECSRETEWGTLLQEHEKECPLSELLLRPWSSSLRQSLSDLMMTPSLRLEPRDALFLPIGSGKFHKLPRFFRWIIPFYLAAMSTPKCEADIDALASSHLGIRHILTLTEETPLPASWFRNKPISNTFLPIPNYRPPSIEQMDIVMQLIEEEQNLPVLIHCGGGKGRAGTVLACYLAAYGFKKPDPYQTQPEFTSTEVVSVLRAIRPGSIETTHQEAFVSKWCSAIWKRQSISPVRPTEPLPCPMEVEGTIETGANLFVLVGLPGSGKSWFSKALVARASKYFRSICQDECGGRAACESAISRKPGYDFILLDRCNTSDVDRKTWLSLASNWAVSPVCIWFDYDRELCLSRAQSRIGHPTLPPGNRVRDAISQMHRQFVRPQLSEGFAAIVRIKSFQAALELVWTLAPPPAFIFKFPRTAHLIDVGGATLDDLVSWDFNLRRTVLGRVVITEKIDGANMGFSLSPDRTNILIQNRSHYVNVETHEQFRQLGKWVEQHRSELYHVLDRDPYYAERYILFGEWMYATHSIPYTHLPDLFIAFDLYDRSIARFVDRPTLEFMLRDTSIPLVPIVEQLENELPSRNKLLELIESTSHFYDGRLEGVYVKVEYVGVVQERGKVVRGDFIAGNEHWSRGQLSQNGILSRDRLGPV